MSEEILKQMRTTLAWVDRKLQAILETNSEAKKRFEEIKKEIYK